MVWCNVVWYGVGGDVVWYGVMWCGFVRCEFVWFYVLWCDVVWFCVVWCEKKGRTWRGRELSEVLVVCTLVLVSRYAFVGRV